MSAAKPKIIAEIGQNHNGDMNLAKEMIHATSEAGADVAKFQIFDAKSLFSSLNNPWYEYNLKTELSFDQISELAAECEKLKIEFMASAFDTTRVGWLEKLGVKTHKIASRSIYDRELAKSMLATNKPVIVSLGMWNSDSFPEWLTNHQTSFLYCISEYPTPIENLHLRKVDFSKYSGFSDHSIGIEASFIAMARGARIIEKHFTLDKEHYGPDHKGSMDPNELSQIVAFARNVELCL
jgi:N,N'-diacetyllegionaminate synthase